MKIMFKKSLALLLTMILCISMIPANVFATEAEGNIIDSGSCGENVTYTLYDSGLMVITGTGDMYDNTRSYDSYRSRIYEVVIDDGVTKIGARAFKEYDSIMSVIIGDSVTNIGEEAFCWCENLTNVTIGDSVTNIERCAFWYCRRLESITIPDSVTSIGDYAFCDCAIKSILIPNSITSIGVGVFEGCSLKSITIPDSVISIGNSAFKYCPLKSITIPNSVTSIGNSAFAYCSFSSIFIPDSVTCIGVQAFYGCESLKDIHMPDGIETIEQGLFSECNNLEEICIPNGVTNIESSAFAYCTSLQSITIPDSVTSIGDDAFYFCISLTEIIFEGDAPALGDGVFVSVVADAYYYCDRAGWEDVELYSGITLRKEHTNLAVMEIVPPSCTEEGYTPIKCLGCNEDLKEDIIPATGHSYDNGVITIAPTCETTGVKTFTCQNDKSHTYTEVIPATGHTEGAVVIENRTDPDCSNEGSYDEVIYCTVCGEEVSRKAVSKNPFGHTPGTAVKENEVAATCLNEGSYDEVIYCTVCGEEISREKKSIDILPHEIVTDPAIEPTCTSLGCTEGTHCSVCDTVIVAQRIVPALGHNHVKGKCTRCGDTITYVEAPKLKSINVESSGKIKLTWNKVANAAAYKIYRATSKNGKYSIMNTVAGTSYTNTASQAGTHYYYYVVAVAKDGTKSEKSNIINRVCDLAKPAVTLTNVASTGKIKVAWKKVEGAAKYEVWRATAKNGKYNKVQTVKTLNWTDKNSTAGKTYYYKVKAIHTNTNANSVYSEIKSRIADLKAPVVKITTSSGKPKVSWAAVTGAKEYKIYRATSKTGKYSPVKTTTAKYWKDTTAKKGKTYYYKVIAVHKNSSANSAYSNIVYKK